MKEKFKKANYKCLKYLGDRQNLLQYVETNQTELFFSNKYHTSWGLICKNTHLEFVYSLAATK